MGKASSNKKVARAASTGGGRTARGARPWGWYGSMALVVLLGSLVIVTSRNERQAASNPAKSEKPRPPDKSKNFPGDHWHAAFGIYICDAFAAPLQAEMDSLGIHTHEDGLIHIEPQTRAVSGRKATLGAFNRAVGMTVRADRIKPPGAKTYKNGDACGKKKGTMRVYLNGDERTGDPGKIRLRDKDELVLAFAPSSADVPKAPPSKAKLAEASGGPDAQTPMPEASNPEGTGSTLPGSPGDTAPGPSAPAPSPAATTPSTTGAATSSSSP